MGYPCKWAPWPSAPGVATRDLAPKPARRGLRRGEGSGSSGSSGRWWGGGVASSWDQEHTKLLCLTAQPARAGWSRLDCQDPGDSGYTPLCGDQAHILSSPQRLGPEAWQPSLPAARSWLPMTTIGVSSPSPAPPRAGPRPCG